MEVMLFSGNFFVTLLPRIKNVGVYYLCPKTILLIQTLKHQETPVAVAAAESTATTKAPVHVQTAHDDFDWSIDKRNVAVYTKDEKSKYDKVYEDTFVAITDGELVKGLVGGLTKTDVVVNIGFKSDGLGIPQRIP